MITEPEPEACKVFYNLDETSYFIMFFGAGFGYFLLGILISSNCNCGNINNRNNRNHPILASPV